MQTEVYTTISADELEALVNDGETLLLRQELGLPKIENVTHFRLMTEEEGEVFKQLFPVETKIEDYKQFIPVEVLRALKDAQSSNPFRPVGSPVVWHAKDYDPDPVLLLPVRKKEDQYTSPEGYVLVARWGDALKPFETLKAAALAAWRSRRLSRLQEIAEEVAANIRLTKIADDINSTSTPSFYA